MKEITSRQEKISKSNEIVDKYSHNQSQNPQRNGRRKNREEEKTRDR